MNFTRLRYFHSVAKMRSFRRAAEVLNISQPSLSRQVKILEHECGVELLKRDSTWIVLTPAGELLVSQIGKLLEEVNDLRAAMVNLGAAQHSRLSVGAIQSTLDHPIPAAIAVLHKQHPNLMISVRGSKSSDIIEAVSRGTLEVGIVATPVIDPRIEVELILKERYVAVLPAGHRLTKLKLIQLADIAVERFVTFPRGYLIRQMIDLSSLEDNTSLAVATELESIEAIKALVRFGNAVSILPQSAVMGEIGSVGLHYVPVVSKRLEREVLAVRLASNRSNTLINQFVVALRQVYDAGV